MRQTEELRPLDLEKGVQVHAAGSCLVKLGRTHVLCAASLEDRVPGWMKGRGSGWLTAEYGMLPAATHTRSDREAAKGKQQGRTVEIQRLIGRSLRQAVDLAALGERTLALDCDVLNADGGTRCAASKGLQASATKDADLGVPACTRLAHCRYTADTCGDPPGPLPVYRGRDGPPRRTMKRYGHEKQLKTCS